MKRKRAFPKDISYVLGQDHTGKVWISRPIRNRDTLYCYANGAFQSVR